MVINIYRPIEGLIRLYKVTKYNFMDSGILVLRVRLVINIYRPGNIGLWVINVYGLGYISVKS